MDPLSLVPTHFEQLKELRNGTISYIQIIKRDQTRPPVRPVCRKLGVSKLSEIKSEAELYEALLCVAQGQSQKARESENFGGYPAEPLSARSGEGDKSPRSITSDYYNPKLHPQILTSPRDSLTHQFPGVRLESVPEFNALLECVLKIRISWDPRDRSQRLDVFAYQYGLNETFLLNALKRICEILGCVHLSPQISVELVINATKIFFRQSYPSKSLSGFSEGSTLPLSVSTPRDEFQTLSARGVNFLPREKLQDTIVSNMYSRPTNDIVNTFPSARSLDLTYGTPRDPDNLTNRLSSRPPVVPGSSMIDGLTMKNRSTLHRDGWQQGNEFTGGFVTARQYENDTISSTRYINDNGINSPRGFNDEIARANLGMKGPEKYPISTIPKMKSSNTENPLYSSQESINSELYEPTYISSPYNYRINNSPSLGIDNFDRTRLSHENSLEFPTAHDSSLHERILLSPSISPSVRDLDNSTSGASKTSYPKSSRSSFLSDNLYAFYEMFWDRVLIIIRSVVYPEEKCGDTLVLLKELHEFITGSIQETSLVLAVDLVLQRVVTEIASKVGKFNPESSVLSVNQSKENIAGCIAVVHQFISSQSSLQLIEVVSFASSKVMQNLTDLLNWCCSDNTSSLEINNSITHLLQNRQASAAIDQVFQNMESELFLSPAWNERLQQFIYKLQSLLDPNLANPTLEAFGGAIIGLGRDHEIVVDMMAKFSEAESYENEFQTARKDISRRITVLESALKAELQADTVIKYFQGILVDLSRANNNLKAQKTSQELISRKNEVIEIALKVAFDSEVICNMGEKFLNSIIDDIQQRRRQPQLKAMLDQLAFLKAQLSDLMKSADSFKLQTLNKVAHLLEKYNYKNIKILRNPRDPVIAFLDSTKTSVISCNLILNQNLYPHSSRLIKSYYEMDRTGKIKSVAGIIQAFAKAHCLQTTLNSYGWNILIIHFLLRFGFLENLQSYEYLPNISSGVNTPRSKLNDVDVTFVENAPLSRGCQDQINRTSVTELLISFFRYFSYEADIFGQVFTLRGKGQVIPKFGWSKFKPKLQWRLCLEDPFETGICENPNDLGNNLSFHDQSKIFRHIRMAYFGLVGLLHSTTDQLRELSRYLFNKEKLSQLAMIGGFKNEMRSPPRSPMVFQPLGFSKLSMLNFDGLFSSPPHSISGSLPDGVYDSIDIAAMISRAMCANSVSEKNTPRSTPRVNTNDAFSNYSPSDKVGEQKVNHFSNYKFKNLELESDTSSEENDDTINMPQQTITTSSRMNSGRESEMSSDRKSSDRKSSPRVPAINITSILQQQNLQIEPITHTHASESAMKGTDSSSSLSFLNFHENNRSARSGIESPYAFQSTSSSPVNLFLNKLTESISISGESNKLYQSVYSFNDPTTITAANTANSSTGEETARTTIDTIVEEDDYISPRLASWLKPKRHVV